jgi:hypothetical protein
MKTQSVYLFIFAVIIVSCAPIAMVAPRADNFSFVYQYISCGSTPLYILDSANGTLAHAPLGDTTTITISFPLTDEEIESIYQKAVSIDFFDYPSEFVIPDDQVIGYQAPASSYELSMTNGEMTNSVMWTDDTMTKPSYTKADKLRELLDLIYEIIQSHPEIKQLPEPRAGCA